MLKDVAEIKSALLSGYDVNILVLMDRIDGNSSDSTVFGEDFTGTRLYSFSAESITRLDGGDFLPTILSDEDTELDMGNIENLRAFIKYGKYYYPAQHYVFDLGNHGSGVGNYSSYGSKAISYDDTDEDFISINEFSTALSADESLDLMILDACYMDYAEVAYEIAPIQDGEENEGFSVSYLLASAAEVVAEGFPYDDFFDKFYAGLGAAGDDGLTGADVGECMLQAQEEHLEEVYGTSTNDSVAKYMTYALLDLSQLDSFKTDLDALAATLGGLQSTVVKAVFGSTSTTSKAISNTDLIHYFTTTWFNWIYYPGVDAYSFLAQIEDCEGVDADLVASCKTRLENTVIDSFGSSSYTGFEDGKHGLALFFPKGNLQYLNGTVWDYQGWYGPDYLLWCADGATAGYGAVENWYELMDAWWSDDGD